MLFYCILISGLTQELCRWFWSSISSSLDGPEQQHLRTTRSPINVSHSLTFLQKVEKRYEAAPSESETLQALVRNELATGVHKAAEGLLWLTR